MVQSLTEPTWFFQSNVNNNKILCGWSGWPVSTQSRLWSAFYNRRVCAGKLTFKAIVWIGGMICHLRWLEIWGPLWPLHCCVLPSQALTYFLLCFGRYMLRCKARNGRDGGCLCSATRTIPCHASFSIDMSGNKKTWPDGSSWLSNHPAFTHVRNSFFFSSTTSPIGRQYTMVNIAMKWKIRPIRPSHLVNPLIC